MKSDTAVRRRQGQDDRPALIAAYPDLYAGLERIKLLEEQFARAGVDSREHRQLAAAIRIEAVVYRKSLDADQAAAMRGRDPRFTDGPGSPKRASAAGKPAPARHRTTRRRPRATNA
jgi:hypothetical protein